MGKITIDISPLFFTIDEKLKGRTKNWYDNDTPYDCPVEADMPYRLKGLLNRVYSQIDYFLTGREEGKVPSKGQKPTTIRQIISEFKQKETDGLEKSIDFECEGREKLAGQRWGNGWGCQGIHDPEKFVKAQRDFLQGKGIQSREDQDFLFALFFEQRLLITSFITLHLFTDVMHWTKIAENTEIVLVSRKSTIGFTYYDKAKSIVYFNGMMPLGKGDKQVGEINYSIKVFLKEKRVVIGARMDVRDEDDSLKNCLQNLLHLQPYRAEEEGVESNADYWIGPFSFIDLRLGTKPFAPWEEEEIDETYLDQRLEDFYAERDAKCPQVAQLTSSQKEAFEYALLSTLLSGKFIKHGEALIKNKLIDLQKKNNVIGEGDDAQELDSMPVNDQEGVLEADDGESMGEMDHINLIGKPKIQLNWKKDGTCTFRVETDLSSKDDNYRYDAGKTVCTGEMVVDKNSATIENEKWYYEKPSWRERVFYGGQVLAEGVLEGPSTRRVDVPKELKDQSNSTAGMLQEMSEEVKALYRKKEETDRRLQNLVQGGSLFSYRTKCMGADGLLRDSRKGDLVSRTICHELVGPSSKGQATWYVDDYDKFEKDDYAVDTQNIISLFFALSFIAMGCREVDVSKVSDERKEGENLSEREVVYLIAALYQVYVYVGCELVKGTDLFQSAEKERAAQAKLDDWHDRGLFEKSTVQGVLLEEQERQKNTSPAVSA